MQNDDLVLTLREDVSWEESSERTIAVKGFGRKITLHNADEITGSLLKKLSSTGGTQKQLADAAFLLLGNAAVLSCYYVISSLENLGMICRSVVSNNLRVATLRPSSPHYRPSVQLASPDRKYRLSRFAYCHRIEEIFVIESPLSHCRILLQDPVAVELITKLSRPLDLEQICTEVDGLESQTVSLLLTLLLQARMLYDEQDPEEERETLLQWDFHDLLFHTRSRLGRHDLPYGGTYRFDGTIKPLPAEKAPISGDVIPLYTPDLDSIQKFDPPFGYVAEQRKSHRIYNEEHPITEKQLGEFLFRVGRTREIIPADGSLGRGHEVASRPYPAAGACYELELYLTIHRCAEIAAGFYHYESRKHTLRKISDPNEYTEALLREAKTSTGMKDLQILITIAARFQRVSWKYQGMAYAAILKNVGVLYQTMYLAATAMGIAACGVGGGDSEIFCRAAGTDPFAEASVGEFLIGSRPRSD